jgi:hypothetical protein
MQLSEVENHMRSMQGSKQYAVLLNEKDGQSGFDMVALFDDFFFLVELKYSKKGRDGESLGMQMLTRKYKLTKVAFSGKFIICTINQSCI